MEGSRQVLDERTQRDMETAVRDRMRQPLTLAQRARVSQRTDMEISELVLQLLMTSVQIQNSPLASASKSSREEERSQSKGSRKGNEIDPSLSPAAGHRLANHNVVSDSSDKDVELMLVIGEDDSSEWSLNLDQDDSGTISIKEEPEDQCTADDDSSELRPSLDQEHPGTLHTDDGPEDT